MRLSVNLWQLLVQLPLTASSELRISVTPLDLDDIFAIKSKLLSHSLTH